VCLSVTRRYCVETPVAYSGPLRANTVLCLFNTSWYACQLRRFSRLYDFQLAASDNVTCFCLSEFCSILQKCLWKSLSSVLGPHSAVTINDGRRAMSGLVGVSNYDGRRGWRLPDSLVGRRARLKNVKSLTKSLNAGWHADNCSYSITKIY